MDFFPDLMKPLSEKNAFDLAREAWLYDEMTKDDLDDDLFKDDLDTDLFSDDFDDDDF